MKIKSLVWDSHFFKKKIGEILCNEDETEVIDGNDYEVLYVKSNHDIQIIINGFVNNYCETKVIFSKKIIESKQITDKHIYPIFETNILKEDLYELAYESGKFSRFKLDDNFKEDDFKKLYQKWVDNSFNKSIADSILIYSEQDNVSGFVTYKKTDKYATIGLIAVSIENQGKGIGSKLIKAVEEELVINGINELRISTQLKNKKACNFYTKLGYRIKNKILIKHYWKL